VFPAPGGIGRDALDQAAAEYGATPLDLYASDGTRLYGWHVRSSGNRLVLYLHGNGEVVTSYVPLYRILARHGWDVLAVAYRGYPGSDGHPSEAGLGLDAEAAWQWASERYRPERIVVHSVRDLARRTAPLYPVDWLLRNPFDTRSRAPRLGVPVLLLHSSDDEVVPVELGGRALRGLIAEVEYVETSGLSHQYCLPVSDASVRKVYLAFLDRLVPDFP
jgi:alpha-beta hydrolase superfamily lysophospholipase